MFDNIKVSLVINNATFEPEVIIALPLTDSHLNLDTDELKIKFANTILEKLKLII